MADATTLRRLALRLEQLASATPKGAGYWPALASGAAETLEQPPQVTQIPVPAAPFVAFAPVGEGHRLIAVAATLADLAGPVSTYLEERGGGGVWLCEIRRALTVT